MGSRIVSSGNLCQVGGKNTAFDIEIQHHFVDAQVRQKEPIESKEISSI